MSAVVACVGLGGALMWGVRAGGEGAGVAPADPLGRELERRLADDVAPLLEAYCFACHGEGRVKGGVRFAGMDTLGGALAMSDDLVYARELLNSHEMPPAGEPAPSDHERLTIVQWLDDALAYYPPDAPVDPGWFTIHRLNRVEYANTLRDLLGIDPAEHDLSAALPPDDTGYGFDNNADVLTVSTLHLEGYLSAAERALDIALGPIVEVSDEVRPVRGLERTVGGSPLDAGGHMIWSNGTVEGAFAFPVGGEYEVVVRAWQTRAGDEPARMVVRIGEREVERYWVEAERGEAGEYRARLRVPQGLRVISAAFVNDYYVKGEADRNLAVESIGVAGPVDEASVERPPIHRRLFGAARGEGAGAAREVLGAFAERAFRRPMREGELDRLAGIYERVRAGGDGHEAGVRVALMGVLTSPAFLYRSVGHPAPDDPASVYELDGHELASRLSYFLWSSMPDAALMRAAERGALGSEEGLRAQVRWMLADEKSEALVRNFAGQWLQLRNLEQVEIDRERFPLYDDALRDAMIHEVELLFGEAVRGDASILDLIDARHTYLNGPLARVYGIDEVRGSVFRRYNFPDGSARGGLLTTPAVLTVTSNPTRTSPVKRGLYVLEQFLGTPPPPPPPDIPRLEESGTRLGPDASLREQLAAHVADPSCAVCHRRMDPIGLAMENFDAIGVWRERDGGRLIDASGELPGGVAIDGVAGDRGLKGVLMSREDLIVENLTSKMLTYALGRGAEGFDRPTIHRVATRVREGGYSMPLMVEEIVVSEAFGTCRGREQR